MPVFEMRDVLRDTYNDAGQWTKIWDCPAKCGMEHT